MGQIAKIMVWCGQRSQWCSREHCGTDCQDYRIVWSAQSVVHMGALWDRLPILRYDVVSTVSGAVVSVVGQIANIKVCCCQYSHWCSR